MSPADIQIREIQAKTILTPQKVGSLAGIYDYSLNPYAGCAFRCSYCYVPSFPNKDHEPREWGTWINVKVNAPELLRRDRQKIFGSRIFFSSATDPYQYVELQYQLTRRCLQELLLYQPARLTLHTRSHLLLRDLDLIKRFGDRLSVGLSITTDSEEIARKFEPSAPALAKRFELARDLRRHGVRVYASAAPLLPCNPENLAGMLAEVVDKMWTDEMGYLEFNTRPHLLAEHAEFFSEEKYSQTVKAVKSRFTALVAQRQARTLSTHQKTSVIL